MVLAPLSRHKRKRWIMTGEGLFLLPPAPDLCQECGYKHNPKLPHNVQTMYYQVAFKMNHGRAVTWKDAVKHCEPQIQEQWERLLRVQGAWTEPASEIPDFVPMPDAALKRGGDAGKR